MQVKTRVSKEPQLYCGLGELKTIAINPSREEIDKIYNIERTEEDTRPPIEYVKENTDGDNQVRISIYAEEISTEEIFSFNFYITDKTRVNRNGDKKEYINQVAQSTWADDPENLPDWFKNFTDRNQNIIAPKNVRPARMGESAFYNFIRTTMRSADIYSPETDFNLDFKKLLREDFSELRQFLIPSGYAFPYTALLYINTVEKDGEFKTYNNIYTDAFLTTGYVAKLNSKCEDYVNTFKNNMDQSTVDYICQCLEIKEEEITNEIVKGFVKNEDLPYSELSNSYEKKAMERFANDVLGEYGCKGYFKLLPIFKYVKGMNITDNPAKVIDDVSSAY
jgi:hypothetical protein